MEVIPKSPNCSSQADSSNEDIRTVSVEGLVISEIGVGHLLMQSTDNTHVLPLHDSVQ